MPTDTVISGSILSIALPEATFKFETLKLAPNGSVEQKRTAFGKFYEEDLGSSTQLDMVAIPGGMFLMVMTLSSSMDYTLDNFFAARRFDLTAYLNGQPRASRVLALAHDVQGIAAAQVQLVFSATMRKQGQRIQEAGLGASVEGLDPASDFVSERIVQGRWLQPGDGFTVVLPQEVATKNNVRVDDVLTLDLGAVVGTTFELQARRAFENLRATDLAFTFDAARLTRGLLGDSSVLRSLAGRRNTFSRLSIRMRASDL